MLFICLFTRSFPRLFFLDAHTLSTVSAPLMPSTQHVCEWCLLVMLKLSRISFWFCTFRHLNHRSPHSHPLLQVQISRSPGLPCRKILLLIWFLLYQYKEQQFYPSCPKQLTTHLSLQKWPALHMSRRQHEASPAAQLLEFFALQQGA